MTLLREPLLQFLILGAVVLGVSDYLEDRTSFTQITISQTQIDSLSKQYQLQTGADPTPPQLRALIDDFIREEILYRQALKLRLNEGDKIIRRRLIQKYQFLHEDLAVPDEPNESQLQQYYRENRLRYMRPGTVTFSHVFFSSDVHGDVAARDAAGKSASDLNHRLIGRASEHGDRFPEGSEFSAISTDELNRTFGTQGLAQEIFNVKIARWSDPLRSAFGWHTIYISAAYPPSVTPFDEARDNIRRDYLADERERLNTATFDQLRDTFQVIRE